MVIIATNKNDKDFQSIVFEVNGLTWEEFCEKVINEEEYINYIGKSSMNFGSTTKRLYHGSVVKEKHDEFHLKVNYVNDDISMFYKTGLDKL